MQQQLKQIAADMTRKYVERYLRPILDTYISQATGKRRGRANCKLDPATTRHAVERFVGPAPRSLTLDLQETVEAFFEEVERLDREGNEE